MKHNILTLFSLSIVLMVISCSSSSTESAATVTDKVTAMDLQTSHTRSAPEMNEEGEFNLLLARKWQNESSAIFLDLKIDGSFEGTFDSENTIIGFWSVSEDQKTLSLKEEHASDGKGVTLNIEYTILDMSSNNMKVSDVDGNEFEFVGS